MTKAESVYYLDLESFPSRFPPESLGAISYAYLRNMQESVEFHGGLTEGKDPRTVSYLCEAYRMATGERDESLDKRTQALLRVTDKIHSVLCQLADDGDYTRHMNRTAGGIMKQVKGISPFMFEHK
jgi:hypothetical protein